MASPAGWAAGRVAVRPPAGRQPRGAGGKCQPAARPATYPAIAATGAGGLPHPGQRPAADRPRSRALPLERAAVDAGAVGRAWPRGAVRRYRPDPQCRLVHQRLPVAPDPGAEPGRVDQGDQGTAPRGAAQRPRLRRAALPRRSGGAPGDGRAAHGADHLQLPRTVRPELRRRPVPAAGPAHRADPRRAGAVAQRAERRWPGLRRRAGAALDLQPRALRRADGERAGAGLSRRTAGADRALPGRRRRRPDPVRLPAGATEPGATGRPGGAGRRDRGRLSADPDAGRVAVAHPAGTGHRHLLHAGPLPDRQPARSRALRRRLAGGGGPPRGAARVVRLECWRNDVAGDPQARSHPHRVPRLERTAGGRPRGTLASAAQARARGRLRPARTAAVPPAPDPPGRGALLVHDEQPPHPHRCLVPWPADERLLRDLRRPRRRPPGEPADAAALPRLHRLAATPGPGAIASLVEREPARLRAADPGTQRPPVPPRARRRERRDDRR
ncbi:hypothetical protein PAERUG_E16_London_17_VIM_2_04_14_06040 [Pseudomonas aeruginosa]|nr:hypothetical protein PAERUG_E16_London_17_VIM_2_04_14_06040 [Pseudomonas aeruginosa]